MKKNFLVIIWSCLVTMSANVFAESMDDLVERDGLYYKKFTDVPFTGEVDDPFAQGSMKNGRKVGSWRIWDDDLAFCEGVFKNDWREGLWRCYWLNGKLKSKGEFRNNKVEGYWKAYDITGGVNGKMTGTFKNGQKISD